MPLWDNMLGRMDGLMGAPQIPQGGVMGEPQVNPQQDMRLALASNLLAGSNSGQGFNTILGKALLAGQAARQNAQDFQQKAREQNSQEQLRQAQINNLQNPQEPDQLRTARALQGDPALAQVYEDMRSHGMDPTDPAAVRIYMFRQRLTPEQRKDFDEHQFAPPQVTFQNTPALGAAVIDPSNRLGRGQVTQLTTPERERAAMVATKGAEATAAATGTASTERYSRQLDTGLDAADSLATVKRGIQLLDEVGTGGIDAVKLKATNLFGVTGADEAELSANLGKAVLSQLRATFGAQFTEKEGARLASIEAGFGKSTQGNKRLLEQAQKILERSARRGLQAAQVLGDGQTAKEIRDAMEFSLSPGATAQPRTAPVPGAPASTPKRVKVDAQGNLIGN